MRRSSHAKTVTPSLGNEPAPSPGEGVPRRVRTLVSPGDAGVVGESDPTLNGLADVYRETCAHILATDDVSLKLLAAVPLAAGIGLALIVRAPSQDLPNVPRSLLYVFAAVITFAIYRLGTQKHRHVLASPRVGRHLRT